MNTLYQISTGASGGAGGFGGLAGLGGSWPCNRNFFWVALGAGGGGGGGGGTNSSIWVMAGGAGGSGGVNSSFWVKAGGAGGSGGAGTCRVTVWAMRAWLDKSRATASVVVIFFIQKFGMRCHAWKIAHKWEKNYLAR